MSEKRKSVKVVKVTRATEISSCEMLLVETGKPLLSTASPPFPPNSSNLSASRRPILWCSWHAGTGIAAQVLPLQRTLAKLGRASVAAVQ